MVKNRVGLLFIPLLLLAACEEAETGPEDNDGETESSVNGLETVAENLDAPWSIDQHEDTFYISERAGGMVKSDAEGTEQQKMGLSDEVSGASEAGLLGFVLSPDFEDSNEAYAYYTYENDEGQFNRVVRLVLSDNGWPVIEGTEEEEGMVSPLFTSGDDTWAPSGMAYHDESLYVAALRGSALMAFDLETEEYSEIITDLGRIRDVMVDGEYLYFISNNTDGRGDPDETDDKLYRLPLTDLE